MLTHLSIRNVVLIEQLDLEFCAGLTVLTGETGAGKSILLDALGLALGSRADFRLIRQNTDRASVTASFEIGTDHPVWNSLDEIGITPTTTLMLRRQLRGDGKSPAHINDQPVSVNMLRQCGDRLIEIQGQFEGRGLLDVDTHLTLIDRAAGHADLLSQLGESWRQLKAVRAELKQVKHTQEKAREDEEWLRDAVEQLDRLDGQAGEENSLSQERARHAHGARISESLQQADMILNSDTGALAAIGQLQALLERQSDISGDLFEGALLALDRSMAELNEAAAQITDAGNHLNSDPERLAFIDDRLHSLREAGRKHRIDADQLPELHENLAKQLADMDDQSGILSRLTAQESAAAHHYHALAEQVSHSRQQTALNIDHAIMGELPPLKLESARFLTVITKLEEHKWSQAGWDKIRFEASTNPGTEFGPIDKIASGGELARFLLALKVVLSENEPPKALIFDEVDSGVGGAVATAVGTRLARLGDKMQTLVITHSPQVASKGIHHLKISRQQGSNGMVSATIALNSEARIEEVARMLSADEVTSEARAAALNLLEFRI